MSGGVHGKGWLMDHWKKAVLPQKQHSTRRYADVATNDGGSCRLMGYPKHATHQYLKRQLALFRNVRRGRNCRDEQSFPTVFAKRAVDKKSEQLVSYEHHPRQSSVGRLRKRDIRYLGGGCLPLTMDGGWMDNASKRSFDPLWCIPFLRVFDHVQGVGCPPLENRQISATLRRLLGWWVVSRGVNKYAEGWKVEGAVGFGTKANRDHSSWRRVHASRLTALQ